MCLDINKVSDTRFVLLVVTMKDETVHTTLAPKLSDGLALYERDSPPPRPLQWCQNGRGGGAWWNAHERL